MPDEKEHPTEETLKAAARTLASKQTPAKRAASQQNVQKATAANKGKHHSEEHKAKLAAAQRARWDRVRAERGEPEPKRPRGRPVGSGKKQQDATSTEEA